MAITTQKSDQLINLDAVPQVIENSHNLHGRLRVAYFRHTQDGTGDAGSSFEAVRLPPGKVRILGSLCNVQAGVAAATPKLDIGWDAYNDLDGTAVAADPDGIVDALTIVTNVPINLNGTATTGVLGAATKAFESQDEVPLRITSTVARADTEVTEGYIVYVQD